MKTPSKYQTAIYDAFKTAKARIAVNAVAGSGKTSTLEGLCKGLSSVDKVDSIFTAFNVSIRDELSKRLPGVNVSNFHRVGKQITENGLGVKSHRDWVNRFKYWNIAEQVMSDRNMDAKKNTEEYDGLKSAINYAQLHLLDVTHKPSFDAMLLEYDIPDFPGLRAMTEEALTIGLLQARNGQCIDFNDMVSIPGFLPELRRPQYGNVFIDECQDLNNAQRNLALSLARDDARIVAVGDRNQAIYGFAGADHNSFDNVRDTIGATDLPLSICYRCPRSHVELAATIVPQIEAAPGAKQGVIEDIRYERSFDLLNPRAGDMVLSRVTAPLVSMAFECISRRIPAKIKGRDIMANLTTTAKTVLKGKPRANWSEFGGLLDEYRFAEETRLRKSTHPSTEAKLAALADKCQALDTLWTASIADGIRDLSGFTKWIEKFFDEDVKGAVVLSTVHKAKGLEAENVFILDPAIMPHPMAKTPAQVQQEMNLKYVALTRSTDKLFMVAPKPLI